MSIRTKALLGWVLALTLLAPLLRGQAISDAERQRFDQIRAKHDRGEQITPEEQQFAQSIMARMNQGQAAAQKQALPAGTSDADRQRFEQIRAKVQRGEQPTPEERQFAQSIMARMNQGQAAAQKQAQAAGISDADRQRFEQIRARHDRGEQITPEEQQFAQSIMARMNQGQPAAQNQDYAKAHPPRASTGLIPLPELGTGMYHGEQGGLYPGGRNTPPAAHLNAGLTLARQVVPRDAEGRPSDAGRIVLLSIGMSNTTQEFSEFQRMAAAEPGLNPKLAIVDGAQGGQTASITADPNANFWKVVAERLNAAHVMDRQVQVVWLKQANAQPTAAFPAEAKKLQADLTATLHNLRDKFPNLKIAYLSSRIYGGYAGTPLNPEPHAYESGFAVKWTIAAQIAGDPELRFDPAKGVTRSGWIAWGPYLWADGIVARSPDGQAYTRADVGPDGTHPSDSGRRKVARQLLDFLKTDPTAKPWFLGK